MKKALVLAGGGTRGSYQNGVIHALRRLGKDDWNIVTGTSIGALNAALVVQKDYRAMDRLWHTLTQDRIVNGAISVDMDITDMINERSQLVPFIKEFIKEKGADITPMIHNINQLYSPEKFFASETDFGCVVCQQGTKKPVFVTKDMMREHGVDWLISTASAYPAFPVHHFEEGDFIDGGYYDNLPIDLALRMGTEEIIAVDLSSEPQHPNYFNRTGITYIFPQVSTGSFLSFDRNTIDRLETLGYYDTMKTFGVFDGVKYTFVQAELPAWYDRFRLDLLMLEERIRRASEISSRLFSSQVITDRLASQQHQKVLTDKRMFYGFMDNLMTLCNLDVEKVWTYREARNEILAGFAECAEEDYNYLPESLTTNHLLNYAATLGTKGIVEKMVHTMLYPEHTFLSDSVWLTVYPFERALADFIGVLLNELKEE
ncbi:MAG: patatin-like phospholipase family protein [Solobacterium sp.]|nr:patatin-like phospholipase family protein [Solobacterium sp.]